jgi:hypothetical protein
MAPWGMGHGDWTRHLVCVAIPVELPRKRAGKVQKYRTSRRTARQVTLYSSFLDGSQKCQD